MHISLPHISLPSSLRHPHLRRRPHATAPTGSGWFAALKAHLSGEPPWEHPHTEAPIHHEDPRHVPKMMLWVPIIVPAVAVTMLILGAVILSQAG